MAQSAIFDRCIETLAMTAFIALIRKDLLLFLGDRRALLLNLMMPILLGAFFGYLFGGSGAADNNRIEIAVVSQDNNPTAQKIVTGLQADSALKVLVMPLKEAKEKVLEGKLNAAIVIPAGFGDAAGAALFGQRSKPEIEVFYDPSQSAVLAMVKGMLTQQVMQQVSAEMFSGAGGQRQIDNSIAELEKNVASNPQSAELREFLLSLRKFQSRAAMPATTAASGAESAAAGGLSMPFVTKDQPMSSGPKYNGYAHSFAGMAVQFILFMGIDAGIGVLLARRQGLWSRLLASPITLHTVLAARAASAAIIAFALLVFIFVVASLFFQVRIAGSMAGFLGVGLCFSLVTATFGLLIAAFGKTPEAARGIAVFATLIMVMLGGAWVPAFLFPQWLQSLTLGVPTRWAVDGLDAMTWRGLELQAALPAMAVQLGFAALFGALALWKFDRDSGASRA
jgi:ABC-2 type transport system permease protein